MQLITDFYKLVPTNITSLQSSHSVENFNSKTFPISRKRFFLANDIMYITYFASTLLKFKDIYKYLYSTEVWGNMLCLYFHNRHDY